MRCLVVLGKTTRDILVIGRTLVIESHSQTVALSTSRPGELSAIEESNNGGNHRNFSLRTRPMATASRFPPPPIFIHRFSPLRPPTKPYCICRSQSLIRRTRFLIWSADLRTRYRLPAGDSPDDSPAAEDPSFDRAVSLFNGGDYHRCHDFLEELWNDAEEPVRTLLHGILQCAVGFHHLFNQNHRGAMMELGEGLCKLRKMDFESGPFLRFEQEVSAALEFLYQTQMELAACTDDFCLTMDGSDRSYQLLGSFAAGQHLYNLDADPEGLRYIIFSPSRRYSPDKPLRVKVPTLHATEEYLLACKL